MRRWKVALSKAQNEPRAGGPRPHWQGRRARDGRRVPRRNRRASRCDRAAGHSRHRQDSPVAGRRRRGQLPRLPAPLLAALGGRDRVLVRWDSPTCSGLPPTTSCRSCRRSSGVRSRPALLLGESNVGADDRAVAAAFLGALRLLAADGPYARRRRRPVAGPASLAALRCALTRLDDAPVAILLAVGGEVPAWLRRSAFEETVRTSTSSA